MTEPSNPCIQVPKAMISAPMFFEANGRKKRVCGDARLLLAMIIRMDASMDEVCPSRKTLAGKFAVSTCTVDRWLEQLKKANLLRIRARRDARFGQLTNVLEPNYSELNRILGGGRKPTAVKTLGTARGGSRGNDDGILKRGFLDD